MAAVVTITMRAAFLAIAAHGDLSGTWVFKGPASPTCRFSQQGDDLIGTCEGPGVSGIAFGLWQNDTVGFSYQWVNKIDGTAGAFEFVGKQDRPGHIVGAMTGSTMASGPFTAERMTERRSGSAP